MAFRALAFIEQTEMAVDVLPVFVIRSVPFAVRTTTGAFAESARSRGEGIHKRRVSGIVAARQRIDAPAAARKRPAVAAFGTTEVVPCYEKSIVRYIGVLAR